jgi:hypothetical protein
VYVFKNDCFYGLVVKVPGHRSTGPGSIPDATRFSEKLWVWNGVHSASWEQLKSYLEEKVAALGQKIENTAIEDPSWRQRGPLYPRKLSLTTPRSCDRSDGIVRSGIQATEFVLLLYEWLCRHVKWETPHQITRSHPPACNIIALLGSNQTEG